jgi:hypothetical protein
MRPIPSMPIRIAIALSAAFVIGAATRALAAGEHAPARHHRHAHIVERATPPPPRLLGRSPSHTPRVDLRVRGCLWAQPRSGLRHPDLGIRQPL